MYGVRESAKRREEREREKHSGFKTLAEAPQMPSSSRSNLFLPFTSLGFFLRSYWHWKWLWLSDVENISSLRIKRIERIEGQV